MSLQPMPAKPSGLSRTPATAASVSARHRCSIPTYDSKGEACVTTLTTTTATTESSAHLPGPSQPGERTSDNHLTSFVGVVFGSRRNRELSDTHRHSPPTPTSTPPRSPIASPARARSSSISDLPNQVNKSGKSRVHEGSGGRP